MAKFSNNDRLKFGNVGNRKINVVKSIEGISSDALIENKKIIIDSDLFCAIFSLEDATRTKPQERVTSCKNQTLKTSPFPNSKQCCLNCKK